MSSARIAARYLSKYVAKTFESESLGGRHRYEVGQGFQPQAVRFSGNSDAQVPAEAIDVMGGKPFSLVGIVRERKLARPACAVVSMGLKARDADEEFDAWLRESCASSGVPVDVTDPEKIRQILTLLKRAG